MALNSGECNEEPLTGEQVLGDIQGFITRMHFIRDTKK